MTIHTIDAHTLETIGNMFIDIGKISALQQRKMDLRFHIDKENKSQEKHLEQARKDRLSLGMFEDCGEFYDTSYQRALGGFESLSFLKEQLKRMEKYQKKCIHEFKATYPSTCFSLLQQEIEKTTTATNAYLATKK